MENDSLIVLWRKDTASKLDSGKEVHLLDTRNSLAILNPLKKSKKLAYHLFEMEENGYPELPKDEGGLGVRNLPKITLVKKAGTI